VFGNWHKCFRPSPEAKRLFGLVVVLLLWLTAASPVQADCPATVPESWEFSPSSTVDRLSPYIRANRRGQDRYVIAHEQRADNWQYRGILGVIRHTTNHVLENMVLFNEPPRDQWTTFHFPTVSPMSSSANYQWFGSWLRRHYLSWDLWDSFGRLLSSTLTPVAGEARINDDGQWMQDHVSSSVMPSSDRVVAVWRSHNYVYNISSINRQVYDANGTPLGLNYTIDLTNVQNETLQNPRVSAFWANEDRYVIVWTKKHWSGTWSLRYAVFRANGNPVSGMEEPVIGLPQAPWADVAAVGSGFMIAYSYSGSAGVSFRTFSADGVPQALWHYITVTESHTPTLPRVSAGTWAPANPPQRGQAYFVVSWGAIDSQNVQRAMYMVVRGVASPVVLVSPQWLSTTWVAHDMHPISSELFTGCDADLRIGFAWAAKSTSAPTGRSGIKKQILALVPGRMSQDYQESAAEMSEEVFGLSSEDDSCIVVVPELGLECPEEPDVPVLEEW